MPKLSTKKINIADYSKTNQLDISKLARSLNPLMDDLERMFRNGINISDNMSCQYITFTCEVDATSTPKTTITLSTSLTTTIKGVITINVVNPNTYPVSAPYVVTDIVGSSIEVKKVFGIPVNTKFDITILVVT